MPGTLEPVEDVSAPGIVDLVKGMSVGLLDSHGVAKTGKGAFLSSVTRSELAASASVV